MHYLRVSAVLITLGSVALLAGCMNKSLPEDPEATGGIVNEFAQAVRNSDEAKVSEMLTAEPLLANEPLPAGAQYPLHIAAALGDEEMVKLLLEKGADPFVQNDEGDYPADQARQAGASEAVINMLEKGLQ